MGASMEARELQGRVARLHYEHHMTHHEIGALLGLSRVKVTRLLAEARRSGIVEIHVHSPLTPFAELEAALTGEFGLDQSWIAPGFADPARTREAVGRAGAECLAALVPSARTVAIGLSATIAAVVPHVRPEPVPGLGLVPLAGSWGGLSRGTSPHELVLNLGTAFQAETYHLPAPVLAADPETGRALRADPAVRETLRRAAGADLLVAGIGGTGRDAGLLVGRLGAHERRRLDEAGAVGDVSGRFFTAAGEPVTGPADERVVGLTLRELAAIPRRVAVACGPHKVTALRTALRTGLMNAVVTDATTAEALLAHEDAPTAQKATAR
ncbi:MULTISPECIES: sugar-binding transcriptional regulator [Streptomyces]|uniref:sugar-binding transcriptional regulator n=1 Tax=Streptomyces TaxID=1883 RepID=UPI0013024F62|nr:MULTISPECIES: sugar-binding transcriptional regulator [Streptomyces]NNG86364.1 sugar-binding transcriptional regulator [Streptomyces cacaoi]